MNVEEVSSIVVDTAFHLHRDLGPGLLESVYETVLAPPDPAYRIADQLRCSDLQGRHQTGGEQPSGLRVFAPSRESESKRHAKTRRRACHEAGVTTSRSHEATSKSPAILSSSQIFAA